MPDWNEIVERNAAMVLNSALRVTGNLADAEDVSQEVFAESFCKWQSSPTQQWAGLLRRMAVCRAIDCVRSGKPSLSLSADSISIELSGNESDGPVENAIASELESRLRIAITNLPDREAQVFCLMYFEQQSHHEIAQTLGVNPTAVATALSRARSKLEIAFREIPTGESK